MYAKVYIKKDGLHIALRRLLACLGGNWLKVAPVFVAEECVF